MDLQKLANDIKKKSDKMLKVFPSGKKAVVGFALGAATMGLGGMPKMVEATDGRPTEKAVEVNVAHVIGLLAMGVSGTVAMAEGFDYAMNSDKKTKQLSPQDLAAAKAGRGM